MDYRKHRQRLLLLMGALMIDAILGIALTTVINFDPSKHNTTQDAILGVHILIAIGIIIGGIVQLVSSLRAHALQLPIGIGFLSSVVAFATGGISADSGNNLGIYYGHLFHHRSRRLWLQLD